VLTSTKMKICHTRSRLSRLLLMYWRILHSAAAADDDDDIFHLCITNNYHGWHNVVSHCQTFYYTRT